MHVSAQNQNALRVRTIHRSKDLLSKELFADRIFRNAVIHRAVEALRFFDGVSWPMQKGSGRDRRRMGL